VSVKITKDNVAALLSNIQSMTRKEVLVGVPGDLAARSGTPINNAALAAIHNNGSPVNNVPARPFLIPGVENAQPQILRLLEAGARRGLERPSEVEDALERAGIVAAMSAKRVITSQEGFEPLAQGTLNARARKGFKGTKALIQTGQLLNSITHVVRDK